MFPGIEDVLSEADEHDIKGTAGVLYGAGMETIVSVLE